MKYPINKEFFPFSHFKLPLPNAEIAGIIGSFLKPPFWIKKDREICVTSETINGHNSQPIEILIFDPSKNGEKLPCLINYHGGGFFLGAAPHHYALAKEYALKTPCKVIFVQYRRIPKHPFPTAVEDCYMALKWATENADNLNIIKNKIAVSGDSAGGNLAAAVSLMARDRALPLPCFQLLVYPATDIKMETPSNRKYTDTPMWNSTLSTLMWKTYLPNKNVENIAYASPADAVSLADLPHTYIETAEIDCLHDEGLAYAEKLKRAGVQTVINETKGTMHGFDIVRQAPTTKKSVEARIKYMQSEFYDVN